MKDDQKQKPQRFFVRISAHDCTGLYHAYVTGIDRDQPDGLVQIRARLRTTGAKRFSRKAADRLVDSVRKNPGGYASLWPVEAIEAVPAC